MDFFSAIAAGGVLTKRVALAGVPEPPLLDEGAEVTLFQVPLVVPVMGTTTVQLELGPDGNDTPDTVSTPPLTLKAPP